MRIMSANVRTIDLSTIRIAQKPVQKPVPTIGRTTPNARERAPSTVSLTGKRQTQVPHL